MLPAILKIQRSTLRWKSIDKCYHLPGVLVTDTTGKRGEETMAAFLKFVWRLLSPPRCAAESCASDRQ